jgi:iron complex outermembrane receptor protein
MSIRPTTNPSRAFLSLPLALVVGYFLAIGPAAADAASAEGSPQRAGGGSTITGTVKTKHAGRPIVGATVEVVGQNRVARTDAAGRFSLGGLPAGTLLLSIKATGFGSATQQVPVDGSQPAEVSITLDVQFHEAPVIVTATPEGRDPLQIYQPADALGAKELEQKAGASLGQTLASEPGVSQAGIGSAPGRPVIRGLGGDRVLILEDGLRIGDVSSISPDHAVATDPSGADQIEIVRGPAVLLYGSNAIGGVINVLSNDVPSRRMERPTGSVLISGGSNAGEASIDADVVASTGPVSYRAGGSHREADEFDFQGGVAGNSQYEIDSGHLGVSLVGPAGSAGIAYRAYDGDYGIPVSEDGDPLDAGDDGVTLDLRSRSMKFRGSIDRSFGPFKGGRFEAVRRDYEHAEIEDTGDVGTRFDFDTTEIRADVTQKDLGHWRGSFGLWRLTQDFSAVGEEVLVPEAKTRGYAAFVYEELAFARVRHLFGARYEDRTVRQPAADIERDFDSWSAAVGSIIELGEPVSLAFNLTRNAKAPSAEELFANGPHAATFAFEVGDPTLRQETSRGIDLSLRFKGSRLDGELTLFKTRFDNFIFIAPTGMVDMDSGLPIFAYEQADADFQGFEWHGDIHLQEHLILELLADYVRGENLGADEPLPRVTPARVGVGLRYETERWFVAGETRVAARQDRVASVETETGGYTLYNLFGGFTLPTGGTLHRVVVRVENLTDKLFRNHVSSVKDIVPQPGRNVQLAYRVLF